MSKNRKASDKYESMHKLKMETAKDIGINLENTNNKPYMGNMTSNVASKMGVGGNLGGEMVKRIIQEQEQKMTKEKK